ncbi:MAG: AAA family ATPase, partial [bacterium]
MQLLRLDVRGVRNLESAVLEPGPHLNLVYGDNGSGKTSLLEAIYLLGRGRSFRSPHINTLVTNGLRKLTVFGEVGSGEADSASTRLGVERDLGGQFRFRIDGVASHSASDLALRLPVIVINAESFS